jgi:hypothetical protein
MTSTPDGPGDYPDRDLPEGDVEVPEGSYTDQETVAEKRGEEPDVRGPDDRGEYTDRDETDPHRPGPAQRGYTSTDTDQDKGNPTTGDGREEHPHG